MKMRLYKTMFLRYNSIFHIKNVFDSVRTFAHFHANNCNEQVKNIQILETGTDISTKEQYVSDNQISWDLSDPERPLGALDTCTEDISHIGPNVIPSFNLAKFANKSHTIREMIKLGVQLYKFDGKPEIAEFLLSIDFDKNVKPYIQFLHDSGISACDLGHFLTKNPLILKEDMDDLYTRIRYLRAHNFNVDEIKIILWKDPKWLSFTVDAIDEKLGFFQKTFNLNGTEVRLLTVNHPRLITFKKSHILENTFAVTQQMGFDKRETKLVLLRAPRVWTKCRRSVLESFDYLHNEMTIPHSIITNEPKVLLCRRRRLDVRHKFLKKLGRAQYEPKKPLYVSPLAIAAGTDLEFCRNIAKVPVDAYNKFMKTFY